MLLYIAWIMYKTCPWPIRPSVPWQLQRWSVVWIHSLLWSLLEQFFTTKPMPGFVFHWFLTIIWLSYIFPGVKKANPRMGVVISLHPRMQDEKQGCAYLLNVCYKCESRVFFVVSGNDIPILHFESLQYMETMKTPTLTSNFCRQWHFPGKWSHTFLSERWWFVMIWPYLYLKASWGQWLQGWPATSQPIAWCTWLGGAKIPMAMLGEVKWCAKAFAAHEFTFKISLNSPEVLYSLESQYWIYWYLLISIVCVLCFFLFSVFNVTFLQLVNWPWIWQLLMQFKVYTPKC